MSAPVLHFAFGVIIPQWFQVSLIAPKIIASALSTLSEPDFAYFLISSFIPLFVCNNSQSKAEREYLMLSFFGFVHQGVSR